MAFMTFVVDYAYTSGSDPVKVEVTVTEQADGTLKFDLEIIEGSGDLRGFFFDINEELLGSLTAYAPDGPDADDQPDPIVFAQGNDAITSVGSNSNNMNGGYIVAEGPNAGMPAYNILPSNNPNPDEDRFDFGIEIGTPGTGTDSYSEFTFFLDSTTRDLELEDLFGMQVGVRIQSTTSPGDSEEGSTKVVDVFPDEPTPPAEVFEGLSHGYWKNHDWDFDKVTRETKFEEFFGFDAGNWIVGKVKNVNQTQTDVTFGKALDGPAYGSALNILAMQAVAAVLNACDDEISYKYSVMEIKTKVYEAFIDGDAAMLALAAELDELNNLGLLPEIVLAVPVPVIPINNAPEITSPNGGDAVALEVAENTTAVADVDATDVDGDTITYTLSGPDAALFSIDTDTGVVTFTNAPDFENPQDEGNDNTYNFTVTVTDDGAGNLTDTQDFAITVTDVNEAPSVALENTVTSTPENGGSIKVADIVVTDDALGTNDLSLSGTDAASFSIVGGNQLWFNGGADFETLASYDVTVDVDDADVGDSPDDSASLTLAITDVNEAPVFTSGTAASVTEHTPTATVVYDANATDDGENSGTLTYLFGGGVDDALFSIDADNGEVRFLASPDFEAPADAGGNNVYDIIVRASDGTLDTDQAVAITVLDVSLPVPYTGTGDPNDFDTAGSGLASTTPVASGSHAGHIHGGNGNDTLVGSDSAETIEAGGGVDIVYGRGGNDTINGEGGGDVSLYGQAGNDTIQGGPGADQIFGGSGDDTIYGYESGSDGGSGANADGADTIYGGSGVDTIRGNNANDLIIGGYGADNVTGGPGSDTFKFLSLLDTNDTITDFLSGTDKLDFTAIDANEEIEGHQAFGWGGMQTGEHVIAHSVTWYTTGGNTVVLADTDGDLTTAEFMVTLSGITSVAEADFLL